MSTDCDHTGCIGYIGCRVKAREAQPPTQEDMDALECWIRVGKIGFDDARRVNTLIEAYNDLVTRAEQARVELKKAPREGAVSGVLVKDLAIAIKNALEKLG